MTSSIIVIHTGGYDSDVEREKKMDYQSKIYAAPLRDAGAGIKPHLQEDKPGTSCTLTTISSSQAVSSQESRG